MSSLIAYPGQTNRPDVLTVEQFHEALPAQIRKRGIGLEVLNSLNSLLADPDMCETYRDGLVGYTTVLNEGNFKLPQYVTAVKYVSLQLGGKNNQEAFRETFPDKWADWIKRNVSPKDMSSYISVYNAGKLVNKIRDQAMIPNYILNQDVRQKMINHLAMLAVSAQSEKVQVEAANAVLNHIKMPEKLKVELEVGEKTGSVMEDLRRETAALAMQMQQAVAAGAMTPQGAAEHKLTIDVVGERID